MTEATYNLSANGNNRSTKTVTVPAEVQREQDISIDDTVEVTIHNVDDIIEQASFETKQVGGDKATIPAHVARRLDLVAKEQYDFSFEKVEDESDEAEDVLEDDSDDVEDDETRLEELFA